jgi:UDP-N-acetylmuramate: L-alanyl-gamma-D-glutamyl-meso-diaminopimelate ligase
METGLKEGSKIYLMGICGTAMASLAGLLKSLGYQVTGVDQNAYPPMSDQLEALGIPYFKGYHENNLYEARPDFVIVGNVISSSNPEVQSLWKLKIPYTSLPKALGELFLKKKQSLVVSGTHGKTTTTSALAWVLESLQLNPGFLIGGIAKNFSTSFRLPEGDFFAIEGDEYDTAFFDKVPKFSHYHPQHAILTSIEFDHGDIYSDIDQIKEAFSLLLKGLNKEGSCLVYHGQDFHIKNLLQSYTEETRTFKTVSYGFGLDHDVCVRTLSGDSSEFSFEVFFKYSGQTHLFKTQMFGEHNALNLTAVIALAHQVLGFSLPAIASAIEGFKGVKRRQEILGQPGGVTVIEDFAHHPTAVYETLKALKKRYFQGRLWAIFEPRSATSRRKIFQKDYVQSFLLADEVWIKRPFDQSKIQEEDRFSSEELVQDLRGKQISATGFQDVKEVVHSVGSQAQRGDVVVIMSNGGFDGIYKLLLNQLETQTLFVKSV